MYALMLTLGASLGHDLLPRHLRVPRVLFELNLRLSYGQMSQQIRQIKSGFDTHRISSNFAQDPFVGRSDDAHDVQQLILVIAPSEEWHACYHLGKNTPTRPDINRCVVCAGSE